MKSKKNKIFKKLIKFVRNISFIGVFTVIGTLIGIIVGLSQFEPIKNYIFNPKIKIASIQKVKTGENVFSEFSISNDGNGEGTDITILIEGLSTDTIILLPYLNHESKVFKQTNAQKKQC